MAIQGGYTPGEYNAILPANVMGIKYFEKDEKLEFQVELAIKTHEAYNKTAYLGCSVEDFQKYTQNPKFAKDKNSGVFGKMAANRIFRFMQIVCPDVKCGLNEEGMLEDGYGNRVDDPWEFVCANNAAKDISVLCYFYKAKNPKTGKVGSRVHDEFGSIDKPASFAKFMDTQIGKGYPKNVTDEPITPKDKDSDTGTDTDDDYPTI